MILMCHCAFTAIGSLADLHFTVIRLTDPIAKYYLSSLAQVFFPSRLGLAVYHSNDELKLIWTAWVKSLALPCCLLLVYPSVSSVPFNITPSNLALSSLLFNQLYLSSLRKIKSILVTNLAQNTSCTAFSKYICSSFKMVISQQFTSSPDSGY